LGWAYGSPFIFETIKLNNIMKKTEPFTIYQIALVMYCCLVGVVIMVIGIIYLLTNFLWLVGVIIGLPLAIYGGLRIHVYLFEGGLEDEFVTNKKK